MSLVAYDASSDEDDAGEPPAAGPAPPPHLSSAIGPQPRPPSPSPSVFAAHQPPAPPPAPSQNVASTNSINVSLPTPSFELPDVADLFASPFLPPRGAAAMVGSSSRKRESNGSAIPPRSKFPRAPSAQPRGARNAAMSTLVPPQLSGRNVASTNSINVSLPTPSFELPDVADLFASPSLLPRGSAAMVVSSSRKRQSNGSAIPPRSKFPRAPSTQPRGARNAAMSILVTPQLSGRSNVVTEDIGKLFVARRKD